MLIPICVFFAILFNSCLSEKREILINEVTSPVQHGEGPHWNDKEQALYYVDTFKATVIRWNPKDNKITSFCMRNSDSIGVIVPIYEKSNMYVVAADRKLYIVKWDGTTNDTAEYDQILFVDQSKPKNQFNDGKADSSGRLWLGTLTRNDDLSVTNYGGELIVINGIPTLKSKVRIINTSISNGIAWSKDTKFFYFIDSVDRNVKRYHFRNDTAEINNMKIIFDLENYNEIKGIPDGMTIDSQDNLWIAIFGGGCILKVDGKSGKLLLKVKMPVTYVTSVVFGGPNLETLYATTSKLKLNDTQMEEQPFAGSVFEISNLGVKGLPTNEFKYNKY